MILMFSSFFSSFFSSLRISTLFLSFFFFGFSDPQRTAKMNPTPRINQKRKGEEPQME